MTTYSTGTVTVTNGSPIVTGVSTFWQGAIIEGDLFALTLAGPFYEIIAFTDTQITLDRNYEAATQAGQAYSILRLSATRQTEFHLNAQVQELIDLYKVNPSIIGGTVDDTVIGGSTAAAGTFTTLVAATATLAAATIAGGTINDTVIGGTTPAAATFTTLAAQSLDGTVIGGTTPAAATVTTLTTTGIADIGNIIRLTGSSKVLRADVDNSSVYVSGGDGSADGANIRLYGGTHSTQARDMLFRSNGVTLSHWDQSGLEWIQHYPHVFRDYVSAFFGTDSDIEIKFDGATGRIWNSTGNLTIDQKANAGLVQIRAKDSGGNLREGIQVGGTVVDVDLYYNNDRVFSTVNQGVAVTHGTSVYLYLRDETGSATNVNALTRFQYGTTDAGWLGFNNSDDLQIKSFLPGSNIVHDTVGNAGGVHIFRVNGTEVAQINNLGIRLGDNDDLRLGDSSDVIMFFNGVNGFIDNHTGDFYITQKNNSQNSWLRADDSSNVARACVRWGGGSPNVSLFYDGSEKLTTKSGGVSVTGTLTATGSYSSTTSSAANVNISSAGLMRRSTSIAAAKDIQKGNRLPDLLAIVMGANPILYKSKIEGDDPNALHWGLVAEEVAELDPALVHWQDGEMVERFETVAGELEAARDDDGNFIRDEDGNVQLVPGPDRIETRLEFSAFETERPAGVQYERFTVPLIAVAQHHQRAIETLAAAVGAIVDPLGDTLTKVHLAVERDRRLAEGFEFDFGDKRGVHEIGTTPADRRGWDEVTTGAQAAIALGEAETEFEIVTNTGAITVTATEWMQVLAAATRHRQPIWKAFFGLSALPDVPKDYANDNRWLTIAA